MLWPLLYERGLDIRFAHRPFHWRNLATNNAGVTCVVAGVTNKPVRTRILYENESRKIVSRIGPYLLEMPRVIVRQTSSPLSDLPFMDYGNKPSDGGHLIMEPEEADKLLQHHPDGHPLVRRYLGSQEFTSSTSRR